MVSRKIQQQGFTLVEVLVAILISTLFVAIGMQAIVFSTVLRIRAQQIAQATDWIQEDLEAVKGQAATQVPYTQTRLSQPAAANQKIIEVEDSIGEFRVGDSVIIGSDSTSNKVEAIDVASNQITLATNLATAQPAGTTTVIARCRPNDGDTTGGFAAYLRDNLPTLARGGATTIAGKQYTLSREGSSSTSPTIRNNRPYEVLEITYKVTPANENSPVAQVSTEVIPDEFFKCP